MSGPHAPAERPDPAAKTTLSADERRRARLCRFLIYACQGITAAISVAIVVLMGRRIGRTGPPPEMWLAWGTNATLGALGAAAAVILFWPVSRERWFRAAACLVFCPIMHLGAAIALAAVAGCFGLIR